MSLTNLIQLDPLLAEIFRLLGEQILSAHRELGCFARFLKGKLQFPEGVSIQIKYRGGSALHSPHLPTNKTHTRPQAYPLPTEEGTTDKLWQDFYLKARARIWR